MDGEAPAVNADPTRTTPTGLASYAREYFYAARAADDVIGSRPGYEGHAPMPVMHLIAHSIELALKAYLLHRGVPLERLRAIGHDLIDCWNCSTEHGIGELIELTETDMDVLEIINHLHKSTELRYIVTGPKTFPVFGPLKIMAKKILDAVCPSVGYR